MLRRVLVRSVPNAGENRGRGGYLVGSSAGPFCEAFSGRGSGMCNVVAGGNVHPFECTCVWRLKAFQPF